MGALASVVLAASIVASVVAAGKIVRDMFHEMDENQYEASRPKVGSPFEEGNVVIKAIEAYRQAKGVFPESLGQLVPDYLNGIPPPNWGTNRWTYEHAPKEGRVYLSVRKREDYYTAHVYGPGGWYYNN